MKVQFSRAGRLSCSASLTAGGYGGAGFDAVSSAGTTACASDARCWSRKDFHPAGRLRRKSTEPADRMCQGYPIKSAMKKMTETKTGSTISGGTRMRMVLPENTGRRETIRNAIKRV